MDDTTAFERLVAARLRHHAGPDSPVDDAAVYHSVVAATRSLMWGFVPAFSATKFVVAGAIVALFGGFLASGVLTQQAPSVPGAATGDAGTFSPTGSLAQPRAAHSATLLPDGRVLVIGGFDVREGDESEISLSTAEIWDPDTDTFGPTGSLAEPRDYHAATLLPDGRVLVVGGSGDGGTADAISAEVWDPSTGTFSPADSTRTFLPDLVTRLPDGRVLVSGLVDDGDVYTTSAWVWDPSTGTFSPADSLFADDFKGFSTALADGRVLIISDEDPYGYAHRASMEVWDPVTDMFSPAGSSALGRIRSYTLLADGRVLFLGEKSSDEDMTSAEVWDPTTSTFSPAGSLPGADRRWNTVTALADGGVLIAGGCSDDDYGCYEEDFDSAEVWDPDTETFGPTGSPAVARLEHTATLLPDGRVLMVGGTADFIQDSAEVWEPGDR